MKLLIALAVAMPMVFAALPNKILMAPEAELWQAWKHKYGKEYETMVEETHRFEIWLNHLEKVSTHNIGYDLGLHTFNVEMNEFTDMTSEEFAAARLGNKKMLKAPVMDHTFVASGSVPSSMDWRDYGYVTPIKNQGSCGSCWAFSTTGGLEGQHMNATGSLVSLSEQQLVDCDTYCFGCGGGWVEKGYTYLAQYGSISEADYPYTSGNGRSGTCQESGKPIAATVSTYVSLPYGNENTLEGAAGTVGPISVAIDASHWSFQVYKSGVYYEASCSTSQLDHAVLVAGYGTYQGTAYWLVKNSWGTSWGIDGYIMMSKDKNNNCGIASDALYPVV